MCLKSCRNWGVRRHWLQDEKKKHNKNVSPRPLLEELSDLFPSSLFSKSMLTVFTVQKHIWSITISNLWFSEEGTGKLISIKALGFITVNTYLLPCVVELNVLKKISVMSSCFISYLSFAACSILLCSHELGRTMGQRVQLSFLLLFLWDAALMLQFCANLFLSTGVWHV